jgi:hypothetical protein
MTASPGREVDANLLRGAAPGSAQTRPDAQDAGGQDLGDLIEALGRGHEIGVEGVRHRAGCRTFALVPVIYRTYQIMKLCLDKTSILRSIAQTSVLERRCHVYGEPITDLNRAVLEQTPSKSHPLETSRSALIMIPSSRSVRIASSQRWFVTERFTRMAIPPLNGHLGFEAPVPPLVVCATSASGLNCHLKWRYM